MWSHIFRQNQIKSARSEQVSISGRRSRQNLVCIFHRSHIHLGRFFSSLPLLLLKRYHYAKEKENPETKLTPKAVNL